MLESTVRDGAEDEVWSVGEVSLYDLKLKSKLLEDVTAMAVTSHGRQHGSMSFNTPPCTYGYRKGVREPPRSRVAKGR